MLRKSLTLGPHQKGVTKNGCYTSEVPFAWNLLYAEKYPEEDFVKPSSEDCGHTVDTRDPTWLEYPRV